MNRRLLGKLALAVVLVSAAAYLLEQRQAAMGPAASGRLWPNFDATLNDIARVRIARGDGSQVNLQRNQDGWQVNERQFAADAGRIRKLLLDLAALEIAEEKTSDPARYAVLGVEAPTTPTAGGTLIELWTAAPEAKSPAFALIVGKSAGGRAFYARQPSEARSLALRPSLTLEAGPARWLDTTLLDMKPDQIRSVEVALPAAAPYTVARAAASDKTLRFVAPAGKPAPATDETAVTGLLGNFTALAFDDVRAAGNAAASHGARVSAFDGLTVTLAGLADGDKRWVRLAAVGTGAAAPMAATLNSRFQNREFEIPSWKFDAIFRRQEDLAPPALR